MKTSRVTTLLALLICGSGHAQIGPQPLRLTSGQANGEHRAGANQQTNVDPAKAADIRRLMDVIGTKKIMEQVLESMEGNIKPLMIKALPPGDYREKLVDLFFAKFQARVDLEELLNLIVPIYDKYMSDDDVRGLIQFYQTPLGQKSLAVRWWLNFKFSHYRPFCRS
jgi:hypothetical protein